MNNPHYEDTEIPSNKEIPLYLIDEYQTYDITGIFNVSSVIRSAISSCWQNINSQQLLTNICCNLQFECCLIDRYTPNSYDFAKDYGLKIFNAFKNYSGSYFYDNSHVSGSNKLGGTDYFSDPIEIELSSNFLEVDLKTITFEIPSSKEKTEIIISYYHYHEDNRTAITISKNYYKLYTSTSTKIITLYFDEPIQVCSIVVSCNSETIKSQIEANINSISSLYLYKNLDSLLNEITAKIDSKINNIWDLHISQTKEVTYYCSLRASAPIGIVLQVDDSSIIANDFERITNSKKNGLEAYFYIYPKYNKWGNLYGTDIIKGEFKYIDSVFKYENIGTNQDPVFELKKQGESYPVIGVEPIYNYGISVNIDRINFHIPSRSYSNSYSDLLYFWHNYDSLGYFGKIPTWYALDRPLCGFLPDDGGFVDNNHPLLTQFFDAISEPPSSFNGGEESSHGEGRQKHWVKNLSRNKNVPHSDTFMHDLLFDVSVENDITLIAVRAKVYHKREENNTFTFKGTYTSYGIFGRTIGVNSSGFVTEEWNLITSGSITNTDNNTGSGTYHAFTIDPYTVTSTRKQTSSINDNNNLFANGTTYFFSDNELIDYFESKYHYSNEFLNTGENTMPDSIRVKETHDYLRLLFNPDKHAYDSNGNDAVFTLGDEIHWIARALGIQFKRDGSIRSIRKRKTLESGDTIPSGYGSGQFEIHIAGGNNNYQDGGDTGDEYLGIQYDNISNNLKSNIFNPDSYDIENGNYVLCENWFQYLQSFKDDLDKALGLQEMSAGIIPSEDGTKTCTFEGMGILLAEVAFMLSKMSRDTSQNLISSLITQAVSYELLKATGQPLTPKAFKVGTSNNTSTSIVFPALSDTAPNSLQQLFIILENLAPIIAYVTEIVEQETN